MAAALFICDSFAPDRGYQENGWSDCLLDNGYQVLLIRATTDCLDQTVEVGLKPSFSQVTVPAQRILNRVLPVAFEPATLESNFDVAFIFGNKHFAERILTTWECNINRSFLFFQEHYNPSFSILQLIRSRISSSAYRLLHSEVATRICSRSTDIVFNTPETHSYLERRGVVFPQKAKIHSASLGVDPSKFCFISRSESENFRLSHSVPLDVSVLLLAGRFSKRKLKLIRRQLMAVEAAMIRSHEIFLLVAGYPSTALSDFPFQSRLRTLPFLSSDLLNAAFNASDVVLFSQPSIGIQQMLCTGGAVVMPNLPSLNQLIDYGSVETYSSIEECSTSIGRALRRFSAFDAEREARAVIAQAEFGFPGQLKRLSLECS